MVSVTCCISVPTGLPTPAVCSTPSCESSLGGAAHKEHASTNQGLVKAGGCQSAPQKMSDDASPAAGTGDGSSLPCCHHAPGNGLDSGLSFAHTSFLMDPSGCRGDAVQEGSMSKQSALRAFPSFPSSPGQC